MMALCLGQARTIRETVQAWPPAVADQDGPLLRVSEMLRDGAAGMVDLAGRVLDGAWIALCEEQIECPQAAGERLDRLLRDVAESLTLLEALLNRRRSAGLALPELAPLAHARKVLDRLVERFRAGWPHLPGREVTAIEQAPPGPRSEGLMLEEFVRGLAAPDRP